MGAAVKACAPPCFRGIDRAIMAVAARAADHVAGLA
jgi:hypothetical protein